MGSDSRLYWSDLLLELVEVDAMAEEKTLEDISKELKTNMEVYGKLKELRKEIKSSLIKEGIKIEDEAKLAKRLGSICSAMVKLEKARNTLIGYLESNQSAGGDNGKPEEGGEGPPPK